MQAEVATCSIASPPPPLCTAFAVMVAIAGVANTLISMSINFYIFVRIPAVSFAEVLVLTFGFLRESVR